VTSSILKLPEKTIHEQRQSKISWNSEHYTSSPDFYTIGYSGKSMNEFIAVLKNAGVSTVVDIRFVPVSRFKPEFSKNNLRRSLENNGINYLHKADWGVPREIRALSIGQKTREAIWAWYDLNIMPHVIKNNTDELFNSMEHPIAFMCVEFDPTECHRHRLALGFERLGLTGCDL
jgi:uncharacterized protein (DUF488 family)